MSPERDSLSTLTIGRTDCILAKRVTSPSQILGYGKGFTWTFRSVPVLDLADLYRILTRIAAHPDKCVFWQVPAPDLDPAEPVRRLAAERHGDDRTLIDPPNGQQWFAVDVDSAAGADFPANPAGAAASIVRLLGLAPDVGYVWQATGSAGFKPGIRLRLWFWLDVPTTRGQLQAWTESTPLADPTLNDAGRIHYTADPILAPGVADPMASAGRWGLVPGIPAHLDLTAPLVAEPARNDPPPYLDPKTRRAAQEAAERIVASEARKVSRLGPGDLWDNTLNSACYVCGQMSWLLPGGVDQARVDLREAVASLADPTFDDRAAEKIERVVAEGATTPALPDGIEVKPPIQIEYAHFDLASWTTPRPPREYVCKGLSITYGRPTIFGGVTGSYKTFGLEQLLLAVSSGARLWGNATKPGRAVYLDAEMDADTVQRRMLALSRGMRLDPSQWAPHLRHASHPDITFDHPKFPEWLRSVASESSLIAFDSLVRFTPGKDENSAKEMDGGLKILTRVSAETKCAMVVVHHAGKTEREDERFVLRGTSAIQSAAGSVWNFHLIGPGQVELRHAKCTHGPLLEPIHLTLEETPSEDPLSDETALALCTTAKVYRHEILCDRLLDLIRDNPDIGRNKLRMMAGVRRSVSQEALDLLIEDGKILNVGNSQDHKYVVTPAAR